MLPYRFNSAVRQAQLTLVGACMLAMTACGPAPSGVAAPLGVHDALQSLATAFDQQSERLAQSPNALFPKDKKVFVEAVFQVAGYDYAATLHSLTPAAFDRADQLHRDLAELVVYPVKGYPTEEAAKIYSPDDLERIRQIQTWLR